MASADLVEKYGFDRFEAAERVLKSNRCIENFRKEKERNGIGDFVERYYYFTIRGKEYCIEVWSNMYYLWVDEMRVLFYRLEVTDTWPNGMRHLEFMSNKGMSTPFGMLWDTIAIIPLEKKRGD